MPKPKQFYVEYEDAELIAKARKREAEGKYTDPSEVIAEWGEYDTLPEAEVSMRYAALENKGYACVRERQHLRDETGPGLPPWTFWDSDDEIVREA